MNRIKYHSGHFFANFEKVTYVAPLHTFLASEMFEFVVMHLPVYPPNTNMLLANTTAEW